MALSIPNLSSEMKTEIEAQFGAPADSNQLLKFCTAVSTAVINHFKNNCDIDLQAGDVVVPAAGLTYSGNPIAGSAMNSAKTISSRLK